MIISKIVDEMHQYVGNRIIRGQIYRETWQIATIYDNKTGVFGKNKDLVIYKFLIDN